MEETKKEIDALIDLIKKSKIYTNYQHITKQMDKSKDINRLINEIKKLQKKAVSEEHNGNELELKKTETIIEGVKKELDDIPLYQEYLFVVGELNDMISNIRNTIENVIND